MDELFPLQEPEEAPKKTRKPRVPKAPKAPKPKKVKPARDMRTVFREKLAGITVEGIKKPWMSEKVFRLVTTAEELEAWVNQILNDTSRHHTWAGTTCPVIAVDTETTSLDTRIFTDIKQLENGEWVLVYEVKVEIAGICLSADGIEGLYVPINHEKGQNVSREDAARILQPLFDKSHLLFYNGKYDREVMKITLGMTFRGYPHFEDVQVLRYINDPKADFGDKSGYQGGAESLKKLSTEVLGIEQIEIEEVAKVRCHVWNPEKNANTLKQKVVPFTWIPPDIALWYAAADAICTWLLWFGMKDMARSRKLVHRIDHELVDSLAYVERQRFLVDVDRRHRTARWHARTLADLKEKLVKLAEAAGGPSNFNPGSTKQLGDLLFKVMGFKPFRTTDGGNASTDKETLVELAKDNPDNEFIVALKDFRELAALHPDNLRYDPKDNSARIYLKQNVVAGGRLSGGGGEFEKDGGLEWNPQGVKKLEKEDFWRVYGNVLEPDSVAEHDIEEHDESELHHSCFVEDKGVKSKAPGIIKNHIGLYQDYAICLVPGCTTCKDKFGILIEDTSLDANQVVNLRVLMTAPAGWTFFSIDYSNIEMRAMANLSLEQKYIDEFMTGSGDFHDLTAKNLFPQYSDPTSKDYKSKTLRGVAKIINFAINYGGTAHAIYKNLIKKDKTMTMKKAEQLVANFWKGVPQFNLWCEGKKARARDAFVTETATGRVLDFKSAMEHEHIHTPTPQEKTLLSRYYDYKREAKKAKEEKDDDRFKSYDDAAQRLWKNPETGVRNAIEYNQFIGKMQRVAVNTPVQGLCGDFMRIAINRIKKWVEKDPDVQKVFRFHGSVHDEIDVSIKNEYVPFIMPRLTRWMKLRKYHESMKWPVPIECDAEYGRSWDVDWSVTKVGYTYIDGLETYVPDMFNSVTVNNLYKFIASGDEAKREKAKGYLEQSLHPRAFEATKKLFEAKDKKAIQRQLIAVLQLHEYWLIDTVPDGDDGDKTLETLAQYEERMGISARDPKCPEFGYMGPIPLDNPNVIRPEPNLLDGPTGEIVGEITASEIEEPETQESLDFQPSEQPSQEFLTHKVGA
jgi:DNA polymerase I-like protein with 3'-5' exonuclease and polymerase domains